MIEGTLSTYQDVKNIVALQTNYDVNNPYFYAIVLWHRKDALEYLSSD